MRILIIGGYGLFGGLLTQRLTRNPSLDVIIAGRDATKAAQHAESVRRDGGAHCSGVALDVSSADFGERLAAIEPDVVVHTAGPFQVQDYRVAEHCINAGVDYIDLADGREFVTNISSLDERARAAGVTMISGASTLPALSSCVVDRLAADMAVVDSIELGVTPGNRTRRGPSTVAAILSYCGAPVRVWRNGGWTSVPGWMDTVREMYPQPVGKRYLSCCEVPDLTLLPERFPSAGSVVFRAGLELGMLHCGMNLLAMLRRAGLAKDWSRHARSLNTIGNLFRRAGSDVGGMHVRVTGRSGERIVERTWFLVAESGDGPFVPTLASAVLIRKQGMGQRLPAGAYPCVGILSLDEFLEEVQDLHIWTRTTSNERSPDI